MEVTRTVRTLTSAEVEALVAQAGPLRRLPRSPVTGTPAITLPPCGRRWPRAVGLSHAGHLTVGGSLVSELAGPTTTIVAPMLLVDEGDQEPSAAALLLTLPPALLAQLPVELPHPGTGDWYRDGHLLLVALTDTQLGELDAVVPLRRTRRTTVARVGRSRPTSSPSSVRPTGRPAGVIG